MPKLSNSLVDKILGSFFLTVYTGIGLMAGIGVVSAAKNNLQEGVADEKKEKDEKKAKDEK